MALAKQPEIYLVTSSVDPNDALRAKGFEDLSGFFTKPLAPDQLNEIIQKASINLF